MDFLFWLLGKLCTSYPGFWLEMKMRGLRRDRG